jgi:hypothetical protein
LLHASSRQGVLGFVALVSVAGGVADGPVGFGADAAGIDDAPGGVAELVGGGLLLSGRAALPADASLGAGEVLGAFEPGVVGVHATIAATTSEAPATRRRE